jgi:hypothetical protein
MKKDKYYYEYRKYVYGPFDDVHKAVKSLKKRHKNDVIAQEYETSLNLLAKVFYQFC